MLEITVTLLLTLSSPLLRAELRDLAAASLALLEAALPREAAAFPALFSLPVYGALIGMFELNNLGTPGASILLSLFAMHHAQIRWCFHCRHSSRRRCTTALPACSRPTTWVHFCWVLRWLRPFSGCSPVGLALCHAEPSCRGIKTALLLVAPPQACASSVLPHLKSTVGLRRFQLCCQLTNTFTRRRGGGFACGGLLPASRCAAGAGAVRGDECRAAAAGCAGRRLRRARRWHGVLRAAELRQPQLRTQCAHHQGEQTSVLSIIDGTAVMMFG